MAKRSKSLARTVGTVPKLPKRAVGETEVAALRRELSEALERQKATSDILDAINSSTIELQPILDMIVRTASRLCKAEFALIYKLRDGKYHLAATNNTASGFVKYASEHPLSPGRGSLIGRVALEQKTVHLPDCLADPEYVALDYQRAGKYRTTLGVPLQQQGAPVGVIALMRAVVKPFTEKQIELVSTFANQAVIAIHNTRLFDEVQARTDDLREALQQQTATADVLKVINRSTFDLQTVLDTLTESAARLCDSDMATVTRQGTTGHFYHVTNYNFPPGWVEYTKTVPLQPSRGSVVGRALLERQAVQIPDVLADPEYTHGEQQKKAGYRTFLGVPLLREGHPIGVFSLCRRTVHPFSEKQIALASSFADQAVIAIENVRLFEEVQARTRELTEALEYQTAISDVLGVISRSPSDLQPVLDTIAETAQRLCKSEHAYIMRLDGGYYHLVAAKDARASRMEYLRNNPLAPNRGSVVGRVALERRPIHVVDVLADAEYSLSMEGDPGYRTVMGIPLLRDGVAIGVIILTRGVVEAFDRRQIELVSTFADQALIAIENVRLFDEVQARTRELSQSVDELRALGEVSQAVNSTVDLQTVLNTIVSKATQLSGTEAGATYVFDNARQEFQLRATYGMNDAIITEIRDRGIKVGESVIGEAVAKRTPIQLPDLQAESSSSVLDVIVRAGFRALLVVPLLAGDRTVGALVVRRKQPGEFPKHTVDLLQTFAAQSVLAIQNASLFESVDARTRELAVSLENLRAAQDRLIQTEKLASLGQLTAGIAHEIKNPLSFVNNFSALSVELIDELADLLKSVQLDQKTRADTGELAELLRGNLEKVVQHGKRADSIVKNMLLHSRQGAGERRPVDLNAIVEDSLNLAYHGARAENQEFRVTLERSFDPGAGKVELLPQEITRVLLNLISNGFYATMKRKAEVPANGYEPLLTAETRDLGDSVEIRIRDNGGGIPPEVQDKMFNPFFTTKPPGEGTGLGLSLSYDIVVNQHSGSIEVNTEPGEFTEFKVTLPRRPIAGKPGAHR